MKKTLCSAACVAGALLVGNTPASAQEAAPPAPPAEVPAHTVAPGDHLWSISAARLGAAERWVEIYASNLDTLDSPDQIEAGQVLKIPATPVDVPADLLDGLSGAPATDRTVATGTPAATAPASGGKATSPSRQTRASGGGDLANIRQCESSGNYQAVSPGGKYRGAYQFDQGTWESVGGSGDPAAASPAEQDARARQLQSQRGNSPWTNCG